MTELTVLVKYEQRYLNMTSLPETINKTQLFFHVKLNNNSMLYLLCKAIFNVYTASNPDWSL